MLRLLQGHFLTGVFLTLALAVLLSACDADGTVVIPASETDASTPTVEDTSTPATDREALIALYNATDGPNWGNNTNWLTNVPIGEWKGVTTDEDGRVVLLGLGNNGLRGELPPELGDLTMLSSLQLWDNNLSGELPRELGNLANLGWLDVSNNQLSGEIPSEVSSLPNLHQVEIAGNELTWPKVALSSIASDRAALTSFYLATNGDEWKRKTYC